MAAEVTRHPVVVVVDDTKSIHQVMQAQVGKICERNGHKVEVISVGDGRNALQALTGEAFDALSPHLSRLKPHGPLNPKTPTAAIMDNQMPQSPNGPVMDNAGIAATQKIREAEEKAASPRHVYIVAHSADSDQAKFKNGTFDGVIAKGSPLAKIEAALNAAHLFD